MKRTKKVKGPHGDTFIERHRCTKKADSLRSKQWWTDEQRDRFYYDWLSPREARKAIERSKAEIAEHHCQIELKDAEAARLRKDDYFVKWYFAQPIDVQAKLRVHAKTIHGFDGQTVHDLNGVPLVAWLSEPHPQKRLIAKMHILANVRRNEGQDGDKYRRHLAAHEAFRKANPSDLRRNTMFDAETVAACLGIKRRAFFAWLGAGKIDPVMIGQQKINRKVVLYDGNKVVDYVFDKLVTPDALITAYTLPSRR